MTQVWRFLAQANIAHDVIWATTAILIISLILLFIMQMILQGRENRFTIFLAKFTGPVLAPVERLLPPISLFGLSFRIGIIVVWWGITMVGALLNQAIPAGW